MTRERLGEKRVSRRWLLGAMGASAGAAGLALAGCSGGGNDSPSPFSSTPDDESPTGGTSPTVQPQDGKRGETLRYTGFVERDQWFDPHKTQAGPFYGHQALIYSRLLNYANQADGTIQPDAAATGGPTSMAFRWSRAPRRPESKATCARAISMRPSLAGCSQTS